jgi:hypothetical protein
VVSGHAAEVIARYAGIKNAQALLEHADVGTTQVYVARRPWTSWRPRSRASASRSKPEWTFYSLETHPANPLEAPTRIEPVASSGHALEPNLLAWVERQAAEAVRLYLPRFNVGDAL